MSANRGKSKYNYEEIWIQMQKGLGPTAISRKLNINKSSARDIVCRIWMQKNLDQKAIRLHELK